MALITPFCVDVNLNLPHPAGKTALSGKTPSIVAFRQRFVTPGGAPQQANHRTGFIAQVRLEPLGSTVFPLQHSSPKERAVAAELKREPRGFAPVVILFRASPALIKGNEPGTTCSFRDPEGVENEIWTVSDADEIGRFLDPLRGQRLVLAAGKAQYEAAIAAKQEWITAAFLNIDDPGVLLLPRHRVVRDKPDFKTGILVMNSRAYFFFHEVTRKMMSLKGNGPHFEAAKAHRLLLPDKEEAGWEHVTAEEAGALVSPGSAHNSIVREGDIVMLAVTRKQTFRLHSQPGWADHVLAHVPSLARNIDVIQLEKIILEGVLELPGNDIRAGKFVSYYRDPIDAVREVERGADVAFIMSTHKVHQLFNLALSGVVLPHNSAELYPSMDGITIHALC